MNAQRINGALRPVPPLAVYLLGLVPLGLLVVQVFTGGLGVDPVKVIERQLGEVALQLIVAGLCITPLRWLTGVNLIRFRRAVGLLAFFYVALHLLTWLLLDLQLRWGEIGADLTKRPYIIVGMVGFALLLPLAITSNNLSIRRMGAAGWQRLHQLTYLAAIAGAVHYVMLVKTWAAEPLLYLGLVVALLAWRAARSLRRAGLRSA
ncbi:protein-methionine-sulfoxide reductase heme-binding subunit MsrQ [Fertoebacter nigrum]|uniref:Protein-methionine-sulfoxide reductase heme-binding subunit MsrQ n=1 Tax=Fertoeibacter niger TaxID=2656921 RepID=A0A8X8H2M3_9RHOB|nr:protein-methionine-sulfoxide reductase heme-binding subunit MsrQ [Fertoeibacter niger]NUB45164.1 protein-methionine-sulfoxide reductase heme-binding subunit MsrQ [Fertoeibacter niger]